MDASAYRAASFLDDRMIGPGLDARLYSLDHVMDDSASVSDAPMGWIFHIGHVGSTLVSRLIGDLPGTFAIREPRSLRDMFVADPARQPGLAGPLGRLMSRRLHGAVPVVKATSFVSERAADLVGACGRALFLYADVRRYCAGILAGPNSRQELTALHPLRDQRLRARGIELTGFDTDDAARAVFAWAAEMTSLEVAGNPIGADRTCWRDFDVMLATMQYELTRACEHLCIAAKPEQVEAVVTGPLMRQYSKAPEYEYSPALRSELLEDAMREHKGAMDAAISRLEEAAAHYPALQAALQRGGGGK